MIKAVGLILAVFMVPFAGFSMQEEKADQQTEVQEMMLTEEVPGSVVVEDLTEIEPVNAAVSSMDLIEKTEPDAKTQTKVIQTPWIAFSKEEKTMGSELVEGEEKSKGDDGKLGEIELPRISMIQKGVD